MEREKLGTRLGFILLSAGCAIGIGNVWKFPWMVGQYGGAAFVLLYLFFLVIMGVPVLTIEFAMGRAAQRSPVKLYQQLEPKGSKWHYHGIVCMLGNYLLMMFYTSVSGWMLNYFVSTVKGDFVGKDSDGVASKFGEMLGNFPEMAIYMAIIVVAGFLICSFKLQKGVERVSKVLMIALLILMIVLAINSCFLDGGEDGLKFYLKPSIQTMKDIGVVNVIVAAMNQAFFTLSLGVGAMAIFGSYIGKDRALMGEAIRVAGLDTFVALCSGLIIFPACFAYGIEPGSGPPLIFITLPNIFNNMENGQFWGALFFLFMTFAALTTVIGAFENIIACNMDLFGWSRKKTCFINTFLMIALSLPCVMGYNLLSGFTPLGEGSTVLDLEDFILSNMLPIGTIIFIVFCTTRYGWGWKKFYKEANEGKGLKVARWMRLYITYILPLIVLSIFIMSLVNFFNK